MDFVTDRSQSDVLLKNAKGTYNATDLNRVERAVQNLAIRAVMHGHILPSMQFKTDWKIPGGEYIASEWPTETHMARYLANVRVIAGTVLDGQLLDTLPTTMNGLTFEGANSIERALEQVDTEYRKIESSWIYSGMVYCGEV